MKKILVTGHSGFLGGHVCRELLSSGHSVFGVSRSITPDRLFPQYGMDVLNNERLLRITREKEIQIIIHCAAKPLVTDCENDPFGTYRSNVMGTASVLEAARRSPWVEKVVLIETDKVYGFQEDVPTDESAVPNPGSHYELSKVLSSRLREFYCEHHGMEVVGVRPVNLFGPGDLSLSRFVPAAMRAVVSGRGIPVHNPALSVKRDFLYVKDAARMISTLSLNPTTHSVYNLSLNRSLSIPEFADRIREVTGHLPEHETIEIPERAREIPSQSIDGRRFLDEFEFDPADLDLAILETREFYM